MKFKNLLNLIEASRETEDAFRKPGEAIAKEKEKSSSTDAKSKDAARKRAERSRKIPRDKLPKTELVKEILIVKNRQNKIQLIFKDSFDPNLHQMVGKDKTITIEDAKTATSDPNFEQTRASKLLFGELKEKPKGQAPMKKAEEKDEKRQKSEEDAGSKKEVRKKETKEEPEKEERPKAKKLSKKEMFRAMQEMSAEQLAMLPPETRDEYFKQLRNPPTNQEFDNLTFESLSVEYGLNPISNLPFNQQVLNALVFLSKLKSGAAAQEMQTLVTLSPAALDFTKKAFLQASKILSQIGDECLQNLLSKTELGGKNINAEGAVDMQCGDYKFKIEAGGEVSISTDKFNQGNKIFKGILATSMNAALMDKLILDRDPFLKKMAGQLKQITGTFNNKLITNQNLSIILNNKEYTKELQNTPIKNMNGEDIGTVLDKDGNLNPAVSFEEYQKKVIKSSKGLFKKDASSKSSPFFQSISKNILNVYLRGEGLKKEQDMPTHLLTVNGVFQITPEYIDELSKNAILNATKNDDPINNDNLSSYDTNAGTLLAKYRTIVESKEKNKNKEPSLNELVVDINEINPLEMISSHFLNSYNFDFNASLVPGFSPKDLNAIEYNYVKIGNKTFKIPVVRNSKVANDLISESYLLLNNLLIESLTNNFILSTFVKLNLLTETEANLLQIPNVILEQNNYDRNDILKEVLHRTLNRVQKRPELLIVACNAISEEYKRDYKKEYRNYHGKLKQRRERAKRTKAREQMEKKGIVKKGDGKDIDHKTPLRSGGSNGINNLRVRNRSNNRADNGHKKGEKQSKDWK